MKLYLYLVISIIGALLLISGFFFIRMNWPDIFLGIYSGPFLMISGWILMVSEYNNFIRGKGVISSRLTIVYKIIIPELSIALFICYRIYTFTTTELLDFLVPFTYFLALLLTVFLLFGLKIKTVALHDEGIIVGTRAQKIIRFSEIQYAHRLFFSFILVKSKKGFILFLPKLSEQIQNPLKPSKSVQFLINKIEGSKNI